MNKHRFEGKITNYLRPNDKNILFLIEMQVFSRLKNSFFIQMKTTSFRTYQFSEHSYEGVNLFIENIDFAIIY